MFWYHDGNPHKSYILRYSHMPQRPCHGYLGGNREELLGSAACA